MAEKIAFITPYYSEFEALFNYSSILKNELEKYCGNVDIICYNLFEGANISDSSILAGKQSVRHLLKLINRNNYNNVLINYAAYGYSKLGLPLNLILLILFLKFTRSGTIVIFHELHASFIGKGSLGSFLSFLQKSTWMSVAFFSNKIVATNNIMFHMLSKVNRKSRLFFIPIFSNIPVLPKTIDSKLTAGVVFGTVGRRKPVYQAFKSANSTLLNGLDVIYDIGELNNEIETLIDSLPVKVEKLGVLSNQEIAGYFRLCSYGFIDYPSHILDKSGIFSAYASYGMCIINTNSEIHKADLNSNHVFLGIHYFDLGSRLEAVKSENDFVIDWYSKRAPQTAAYSFYKLISSTNEVSDNH